MFVQHIEVLLCDGSIYRLRTLRIQEDMSKDNVPGLFERVSQNLIVVAARLDLADLLHYRRASLPLNICFQLLQRFYCRILLRKWKVEIKDYESRSIFRQLIHHLRVGIARNGKRAHSL